MAKEYAEDYSIKELLTSFLSHDLEDGEILGAGAALPIARAAVLLAHLTHGPNMTIQLGYSKTNLLSVPVVESFEFECDYRGTRWAECYYRDDEEVSWVKQLMKTKFFVGAIQIDKYGNSNLIGVGDDFKKLKLRGPGAAGTSTVTTFVKCYYLMPTHHDTRTFVEKCDFISSVGWGEGGVEARRKLGLPGGGPKYVLTPLCIMDFEEQTKRARLRSIHPGVTVEQVIENTGFELVVPDDVPFTEAPTKEEIGLLRTRIDVEGILRK